MIKNKGVITAKEISNENISSGIISYLVKKGSLVHSSRGIYTLPNVIEDEFLNLQVRFKRGIFSNETALFLWKDYWNEYLCQRIKIILF